jgi:hypothetical protein
LIGDEENISGYTEKGEVLETTGKTKRQRIICNLALRVTYATTNYGHRI